MLAGLLVFLCVTGGAVGFASNEDVEAQQAEPPGPVWTRAAEAPEGLLTPREVELHDRFIERAQAGDIDIVFFGTPDTETWRSGARGRSVWDRAFGSVAAANFGSQGTRVESLLRRMQHGELDGYQAKLVVLQTLDPGDRLEYVAGNTAIVAEIRARQPQARILLFAPLPRGQTRELWRERAETDAGALAGLVDDEIVFHVDIGDRFYHPDGSFRSEMWSLDPATRGRQTPAFEVWAEELQPWIDHFVN
jgi:hypothetical protein